MKQYVLDACAMIAYFRDEHGAKHVDDLMRLAQSGSVRLRMHSLNLLEIYYDTYRLAGAEAAEEVLRITASLPISITSSMGHKRLRIAGRLKAMHKISLADSICISEAIMCSGTVVTSDRSEMESLQNTENISFLWLR